LLLSPDFSVLKRVTDFAAFIASPPDEAAFSALRGAEAIGRPLGSEDFVAGLEKLLGRQIARRAPGRKKSAGGGHQPDLF
jgi:putative transposase